MLLAGCRKTRQSHHRIPLIRGGRNPRSAADSIAKEFLEPLRRQRGIARRILNVAMSEIRLDRARVVAVVGELVATGMAEHVGVRLDAEVGRDGCPPDHAGEAGRRKRCGALRDKVGRPHEVVQITQAL